MLTPHESGFGMLVYQLYRSCSGCGDEIPFWLIPAFCRWQSIVGPDGMVDEAVTQAFVGEESRYSDALRGPMVGIAEIYQPEHVDCSLGHSETVPSNLDMEEHEMCDPDSIGEYFENVGYLIGMVPVLNIIPIEAEFFAAWYPQLKEAWKAYDTIWFNYTTCGCNEEVGETDECLVAQWEEENGPKGWSDGDLLNLRWYADANCGCPVHLFNQEFIGLLEHQPSFVEQVDDDLLEATWAYALDRYFTGLKWLDEQAPRRHLDVTKENAWFISYSQRFSPYWASHGLNGFLNQQGLVRYAA